MKPFFSQNEHGFTLAELLVSMALLSLMAIYALQAFTTLKNMNRVEAQVAENLEIASVMRYLRNDISKIQSTMKTENGGAQILMFEGQEHQLSFVTTSNGDRETGGLHSVQLSVDENKVFKVQRQILGSTQTTEVILLGNVAAITFTYDAKSTPPSQTKTWREATSLPAAIEISIEFANGDHRIRSTTVNTIAVSF